MFDKPAGQEVSPHYGTLKPTKTNAQPHAIHADRSVDLLSQVKDAS
ncbi:MAG: hypothetical protein AAGJ40_24475 [Planctomycetota bacterium]